MFKPLPSLLLILLLGCSGGPAEDDGPTDAELGFPTGFAYCSRTGKMSGIYLRDKNGDKLLTSGFKLAEGPAWSPDGRKLAFHSNDDGKFAVYVLDVASGKSRKLTDGQSNDMHPAWSPDGKTIAFESDRGAKIDFAVDIFLMDADGGNVRRLTRIGATDSPAWSPDGKRIAFSAPVSDGPRLMRRVSALKPDRVKTDIYTVAPDGSGLRKLTDGKTAARFPAWSPDGKQLVFCSSAGDRKKWQLEIMNANGSNRRHLTWFTGDNLCPSWTPHKAKILFHSIGEAPPNNTAELWAVNYDSTGVKQLSHSEADNHSPAWRPVVRD